MKRIFPWIFVLVSLSMIGIIVLQISWIKSMILVSEEQIQHNINDATKSAGYDLAEHKSNFSITPTKKGMSLLPDDMPFDFTKPIYIGQRVNINDVRNLIVHAFLENNLKISDFEFAIMAFGPNNSSSFEKQTPSFFNLMKDKDSVNNFFSNVAIEALSGTAAENLSANEVLFVIVPHKKELVNRSLFWRIFISAVFTVIILAAFYLTVRTMLRQKKLAKIKNDFINNMTHEFKTPLATISLAVDAMHNEKVIDDREKMNYFSGIIKEENQRMHRQVETILKASQLDKQEVELTLSPLHVHDVIREVTDTFLLQLQEKKGSIQLDLQAVNDLVEADDVHLANCINNLIDNALKYARENVPPAVTVRTSSTHKKLFIRIEDNGIGMTRDTLRKIFERFFRAHTGNVHNVKGFGLGLSYVKTMIEEQRGHVKAESTLGKGSTFTIEMPLQQT